MIIELTVVVALAASSVLLCSAYFRRYQVSRPPIGVFNLRDVAVLLAAIVFIPYLYLALPLGVIATLLVLTALGILYFTCDPVIRERRTLVAVVLAALAADITTALIEGTASNTFLAVNNIVLVVIVVGVANLWAQSGMKARDATVLAAALAAYDFVATSQLTLMTDLIDRLSEIPLVPFIAWREGDGALGIGLGDLLLAGVFPLVMRKAFGRRAATTALVVGVAVVGTVLGLIQTGVIDFTVPVMVVLGPLMVVQYAAWTRRHGHERTTWEYLRAEPLTAAAARTST
jgi:hypothetical protein